MEDQRIRRISFRFGVAGGIILGLIGSILIMSQTSVQNGMNGGGESVIGNGALCFLAICLPVLILAKLISFFLVKKRTIFEKSLIPGLVGAILLAIVGIFSPDQDSSVNQVSLFMKILELWPFAIAGFLIGWIPSFLVIWAIGAFKKPKNPS